MNRTLLLAALLVPASALAQAPEPLAVLTPVHARGVYAADRPADVAPPSLDERATTVLDGWTRGDLGPTVEALATDRRAEGEADLARVLRIFIGHYGPIQSYRLVGTETRADGRSETIAEVTFAEGAEQLRLVWDGEGRQPLLTISRAARRAAGCTN